MIEVSQEILARCRSNTETLLALLTMQSESSKLAKYVLRNATRRLDHEISAVCCLYSQEGGERHFWGSQINIVLDLNDSFVNT